MDDKENFSEGVHVTRKSRSLQLTQKHTRSHSVLHERPMCENFKKPTVGPKSEHSPKSEDSKEKKQTSNNFGLLLRPSTASSDSRKKSAQRDRSLSPFTSKSFSTPCRNAVFDGVSIGSSSSAPPSAITKDRKQSLKKTKLKNVTKFKVDFPEDFETISLLTLAVNELGSTIETWRKTMEGLRTLFKETKPNPYHSKFGSVPETCSEESSFLGFEDSHGGTLEEICQVWVHLIYFIINIKINIVQLMRIADVEPLRQNVEIERNIIEQAIGSAKFFSSLKMKSLVSSLEEYCYTDKQNLENLKNYEKRVSAPFLSEMDFIHKKAQEILKK